MFTTRRPGAVAFISLALLASPAAAQDIRLPRVSPGASVSQRIGLTDIRIDYHRPATKGRTIWGGLVPYDSVWRAGANDNTTISFSEAVSIGGQPLAAGTYGLHVLPGRASWTFIFSHNSTSWGSFTYDPEEDALRVSVTPEAAPLEEWLSYSFSDLAPDSAIIALRWEKLSAAFKVETDTHAIALSHIRKELRHLPRFRWQGWYQAARYAADEHIDQEEALGWIERSISMDRNFNNLRVKSELLGGLGRKAEADEVLASSWQYASEADINNLGYASLQSGDADKALELFQMNVSKHPESWNAQDSLAETYAARGDKKLAITHYAKALEAAPDDQKRRIGSLLSELKK